MSAAFVPGRNELSPAEAIFRFLPAKEQSEFLKTLLGSIRIDDHSNLDFVASIVVQSADHEVKHELLAILDAAIRDGAVHSSVSLGLRYPILGKQLVERAVDAISDVKSASDQIQPGDGAVLSYLSFVQATISHFPLVDAHSKLLIACLELLGAQEEEVSMSARDIVFSLLSASDSTVRLNVILPSRSHIWNQIEKLVSSDTNKHLLLHGYSLWLRWLLCMNGEHIKEFVTERYWQQLIYGIRKGDSERRKICLNILKLTTTADSAVVDKGIGHQYDRYCTVFETIVLGRYINQILECEKDLDFLATDSPLEPRWLYTLLASSLESQMQESNRRFIGNWVMRSPLPPTKDFIAFFKDYFLPWATQGQLFVSTLQKQNGILRCMHGDKLAQFLQRDHAQPQHLTDVVMDTILLKKHTLFSYAIVYLLEGLGETLRNHHLESLGSIDALPEVARDYVAMKASKVQYSNEKKMITSRRETLEKRAIEKCQEFNPDVDHVEDLWSDLDYLEYPKELLMKIPAVLFHPQLVESATRAPLQAADLAYKLEVLRKIAETKTYLFAPLLNALRNAVADVLAAVEVLNFRDFIVRVTEHPPEPTIDLMLEEATLYLTQAKYEHYFGERLSYAFAAFLDLVSRLQQNQLVVSQVLYRVLERWKDQKLPPPTVSTWKTTLQLQVVLLCLEQYNLNSMDEIHILVEDLFHILSIEPLPRYRYLLEWIIVRLFMRYDLEDFLLQRLATKDHHSNPKHLASLMKIGVILARREESAESFACRLATSFVPLAASSKVVIRHEAQWQVPLLMDHARTQDWTNITNNPALTALDEYIRSLERFHDPPLERKIGRLDPATDHTLTNLVQGCWFGLDQTEGPLTSRDDFVKLYGQDSLFNRFEACMPLGGEIDRVVTSPEETVRITANGSAIGPHTSGEASALQTKGTAYLARTLSDPSLRADDVIVVGSLVDNPHNLGGLSRVAEIFGASELCLQNQNILSNNDFKCVSVSSHRHFPIVQLSSSAIPEFLTERKSQGFTVVGIEQTDRSIVLGSKTAKLPKKVVLIVGSEKEGIPAVVLTGCDMLLEIPQQGITRSLNVQTAVAIVLYEHARQHRGGSKLDSDSR